MMGKVQQLLEEGGAVGIGHLEDEGVVVRRRNQAYHLIGIAFRKLGHADDDALENDVRHSTG